MWNSEFFHPIKNYESYKEVKKYDPHQEKETINRNRPRNDIELVDKGIKTE